MGSEKKRKRVSSDATEDGSAALDKSERKRLKKLKKDAESVENGNPGHSESDPKAVESEVIPLVSPIASRKSDTIEVFRKFFALFPFFCCVYCYDMTPI